MNSSGKFLATAVLLAVTWLASSVSANRSPEQLAQPLETIPSQVGDWTGSEDRGLRAETETVLKATAYLSRIYSRNETQLDFFTAFYALQEAGETMHSPRNCLPGSGWEVWRHSTVDFEVDGKTVTLNEYGVQNGARRMIVLYWDQTPERIIASEYYAKLCLVWDAVVRSRTSGSIVRDVAPDRPGSLEAATEFAAKMIPEVQKCLPPAS
jgi:EpsI family protein